MRQALLGGNDAPKTVAVETQSKTNLNVGAKGNAGKLKLKNCEYGKVCTRFPPEPSGYMHIGHLKAALMNNYFARAYGGTLLLRFDDTNPSKEKTEFVDAFLRDLKILNIVPDRISHSSDHFDKVMELATKMIQEGKAYVDSTEKEQIKKERFDGIESQCRSHPIDVNLKMWKEMIEGTPEGQTYVLRAKIDMKNPNKCLRDPAIYRCNVNTPHLRTKTKYKVYPLYDFVCPILDSIEGVTHALRSSEYHDHNPLYHWVIKALGLRHVELEDFSRLDFKWTLLSKRKLQWFVDNGHVDSWDDPRFPTIQGILRRGMSVEVLTEYILSLGPSKTPTRQEMDKLWALNKKFIDPNVPRYSVVDAEDRVVLHIDGAPTEVEARNVARHKKNPALGQKTTRYLNRVWIEGIDAASFAVGEQVTLMDWGNVAITAVDKEGEKVSAVHGKFIPNGDFSETKKITWLADTKDLIDVDIIEYDTIITKDHLEPDEDFVNFVRTPSRFQFKAIGDANLRLLNVGDKIQLERRGYFICDRINSERSTLTLIMVPDGRARDHSVLGKKVEHRR